MVAVVSMMVMVTQGSLVMVVDLVIGSGRGCDGGGGGLRWLMVDVVGCVCELWGFVVVGIKS